MAKVQYTKTEQFLIDNVSNIGNVPLFKIEDIAEQIEISAEHGGGYIGVYIESSRSKVTDNTVYELLSSYTYNSTLHGDWVWIDTKNLKIIKD